MSNLRPLIVAAVLLLSPAVATSVENSSSVPGWVISGSAAKKYSASIDKSVAYSGSASASLVATTDVKGFEFGTLMQIVDARPHIGERMRFSAYVRTAGVTTGAALWMRIDGEDGEVLAFDNMSRRGLIRGDQSWTPIDVVLDVPAKGKVISFGVLLKGEGMVWVDEVSLNPVMRHIATTGFEVQQHLPVAPDELPDTPKNLDFETGFVAENRRVFVKDVGDQQRDTDRTSRC